MDQFAWELRNHPNRQLCNFVLDGLRNGFKLGFQPALSLKSAKKNKPSAYQQPLVIDEYLAHEVSRGRVAGPFRSPPLPDLHISSFGVIPKKGQPGKWRLIVDLSSPGGASVNDGINAHEFTFHYITVDQIIRMVSRLGRGALMAKFDVEAAYRNIPVHPSDRFLLGMKWRESYKKIALMQEETPPSELFGYFKELLVEYPRHSKSRHCVGDLSCSLADFGFINQRNYLKTSHAKGEQDAAGLHVKQKVSQAVLTRLATINSAKAMHKFLTEKFTQPAASSFTASSNSVQLKRRVSFYVPGKGEGAVIRNRPGRKFKEVKGIRKLHCIKSGSEQEKVLARQRSCYCISCILDDEENCSNKAWLDDWKEVLVSRDGSVATTRQTTQEFGLDQGTASHIADLAVKGTTVAIAADDDPMYDFSLLKLTSEGVEELDENYTDNYEFTALRGTQVLKGHFYLRDNIHDMTFTLDENRTAVVYASTVRQICGDIPCKKRGPNISTSCF